MNTSVFVGRPVRLMSALSLPSHIGIVARWLDSLTVLVGSLLNISISEPQQPADADEQVPEEGPGQHGETQYPLLV